MIRKFRAQDTEALAEVYRDSVRSLGPVAYSREQVEVWASWPDDIAKFSDRVSRGLTLVADVDNRILAFGQLEPEDHVALIFCRGSASRQGLCSQIYRALEAHAFSVGVEEIRTEASRIGRPFFEKHGFLLREVELCFIAASSSSASAWQKTGRTRREIQRWDRSRLVLSNPNRNEMVG